MGMQNIDIDEIDDLQQLKALAYDQIANKELAQNNLNKINARIAQLQNMGEEFGKALLSQKPKGKKADPEP